MSKRRWFAAVVGICLAWRWLHTADDEPSPAPPPLQLAVLADGYAVAEAYEDRHLIELDTNGARRKRWAIPLLGDLRIVGSTMGSTVAWIDARNKVLRLAALKKDAQLGPSAAFGRNAKQLCDGAASTATGFAVAWQAADRGLWFVRGPLVKQLGETAALEKVPDASIVAASGGTTPMACAVRAAGDSIALFWRAGRTMDLDICPPAGCQGLRARVPIHANERIVDLACQEAGCVAATVTRSRARLVGFDLRGKVRWESALPARADHDVHVIATGPDAYAVSYEDQTSVAIDRVLARTGARTREWVGSSELTVPVMTWARDQLALAYADHDALGTLVRYWPR